MGMNDDKMFRSQMTHIDYTVTFISDIPLRSYGCISGNVCDCVDMFFFFLWCWGLDMFIFKTKVMSLTKWKEGK